MDDHSSGGRGSRPDGQHDGDEQDRGSDQEYFWEGRPGEDFGPIVPPPAAPHTRERGRLIQDDEASPSQVARRSVGEGPATVAGTVDGQRGAQARPIRRRRWRPIVTMIGALLVLGVLAGAVLFVIGRQTTKTGAPTAVPNPGATTSPVPVAASPDVPAGQAGLSPIVVSTASPVPVASPTPLALAPATASPLPAPVRSPSVATGPTARPSPVIFPTFPVPAALVTPPGQRFATATPARLGTPSPTRTAPPVPTIRPPTFLTRVWSEQAIYKVGDQATICGAAPAGMTAELSVIGPDRSNRTLGEFQPPSERVCYAMKVDEAGLYVLTLIIKDGNGVETDRQSAALFANR